MPELTGVSVDWVAKADSTDPLTNGDKQAVLRTVLVTCESALLIAPEMDGELTELARLAESLGVRLVSPGSDCCRLFSDKLQTANHLTRSVPSQLIPPPHKNRRSMSCAIWWLTPAGIATRVLSSSPSTARAAMAFTSAASGNLPTDYQP